MKFIMNIPNILSLLRILLLPLFIWALVMEFPFKNISATAIFLLLAASDYLDGHYARKHKQVTDFGKIIDPIADKFLITTALVYLTVQGLDLWISSVIIFREMLITAIRFCLIPFRIVIAASKLGKLKTVSQIVAISFGIMQFPFFWHLMVIAAILTLISGIEYLILIKKKTGTKIINIPNLITLVRLVLILPYTFYMLDLRINISLILFGIISLGDKIDGTFARFLKQSTKLGSVFDSLTDLIFVSVTAALFVATGTFSINLGLLLLIPFLMIAVLSVIYLKKHKKKLTSSVSKIAVGSGYVTILAILINFVFKDYLIMITTALLYLSLIIFIFKTIK